MAGKVHAFIVDGYVHEIIQPVFGADGEEIPVTSRFTPEYLESVVDITDMDPVPQEWWPYADGKFSPPAEPSAPSAEQTLEANNIFKMRLLADATLALAPYQDAVDDKSATPEETAMLKRWKQYRIAINRVDLSVQSPEWPQSPLVSAGK